MSIGLELESHAEDGSSLVHVVDKIILVVVDIQNSITKYQSDLRIYVVASTGENLPRKLRTTAAEIKFAGEEHLLRQSHLAAQSAHRIHPIPAGLYAGCRQNSGAEFEVSTDVPDTSTT